MIQHTRDSSSLLFHLRHHSLFLTNKSPSIMAEITLNHEQKFSIDVHKVKWAKHYNSNHQILLVGEGDFSFSLSLAMAFGCASNIVATSLDSYDVLIKKYRSAKANLQILTIYGAKLLHGVDVTETKLDTDLQMRKFDRIIYNFPHAGFLGREDDPQVIMIHRKLVFGFFKNASGMLRASGEVHVRHKTTYPFQYWYIEELAAQNSLALLESVKFKLKDYPGYNNKRGDGKSPDKSFPLGECSTYKFILFSATKESTRDPYQPGIFLSEGANASLVKNHAPVSNSSECFWIFREYFHHANSTYGHVDDYLSYSVPYMLGIGFERCKAENRVNPSSNYINLLKELRYLSIRRIEFLRNRLLELDHGHRL